MLEEDQAKQSSIQVVVRVRPFTDQEKARLWATESNSHTNGNDGTHNSRTSLALNDDSIILAPTTTLENTTTGSLLDQWKFRPEGVKKIIDCVDDKMLIFDPHTNKNSSDIFNPTQANTNKQSSTSRKISSVLLNNPESLNNLNFIGSGNEPLTKPSSAFQTRSITPRKRKISISKKPFSPQSPSTANINFSNGNASGNNTSPTLPRRRKSNMMEHPSLNSGARRISSPSPVHTSSNSSASSSNSYRHEHKFIFDRVFDEDATQNDLYEYTTRPLLNSILQGYNCTIFAYGATGCGKTYTINGDPSASDNSESRKSGLVYKAINELFEKLHNLEVNENKEYELSMSYLEIYNETIKDLLSPQTPSKRLIIREDSDKRIQVSNLSYHKPETLEDIMDLINFGNTYRTINETEANKTSSRSHSVLQISVLIKDKALNDDLSETQISSVLSIIDLAGSERACNTKNRGERLQEGANINRSLLALGNCINALCNYSQVNSNTSSNASSPQPHIPYRDSKLTRLLKFSLGGNCKTVMIVCCSPSSEHYDETLNTLKYANRAKEIKTKLLRNSLNMNHHVGSYLKIIEQQRLEIKKMKQMNESFFANKREKINFKIFEIINGIESKLNKSEKFTNFKFKKSLILCKRRYLQMNILSINQVIDMYELCINEQFKDSISSSVGKPSLQIEYSQILSYLKDICEKLNEKIQLLEIQYESEDYLIDSFIDYENVMSYLPLNIDSYNETIDLPIVESLINNIKENISNEVLTNSIIMIENLIKDHKQIFTIPTDVLYAGFNKNTVNLKTVFQKLETVINNIDPKFEEFSTLMFANLFSGENAENDLISMYSEEIPNNENLSMDTKIYKKTEKKKLRWTDTIVEDLEMGGEEENTPHDYSVDDYNSYSLNQSDNNITNASNDSVIIRMEDDLNGNGNLGNPSIENFLNNDDNIGVETNDQEMGLEYVDNNNIVSTKGKVST